MTRLLVDPYRHAFMLRALIEILLLAVGGSVVGVHVLLRRRAFLTEAVQHSVFPGIAVAFVTGFSLFAGAVIAGLLTVVLLTVLSRRSRREPDAVMALLIAGAFALGVVIVSRRTGYQSDLTALLFGRILDVDLAEIVQTALVTVLCIGVVAGLHKELVLRALDPVHASAVGYRTEWLDLALDVVTMLVVVTAVRALGTVLVLAFIVTPPAAARLVTKRLGTMTAAAVALAITGSWLGLTLSYEMSVGRGVRLAAGATVVVILTLGFLGAAGLAGVRRALAR